MNKVFAVLLASSLCACASTQTVAVQPVDTSIITLEVAGLQHVKAFRCSDELECLQRLGHVCANGFNNGALLNAGANKIVGIQFRCITNEEKAAREAMLLKRAEEEKEYDALRTARLAQDKAEQARVAAAKQGLDKMKK